MTERRHGAPGPRANAPEAFRSLGALRAVSLVSFAYDAALGVAMLAGRSLLAQWFGVPAPVPPIHADLNGLFALAVAAGYLLPYRDPERYRAYLWVMGPVLKGGGAVLFVADHLLRGSPSSFLLFAAADGSIAALTLWALVRSHPLRRARNT